MSDIRWMKIADSNWPRPSMEQDAEHGVGWKLRYQPESLTREEQMYAASVISAYGYLLVEGTNDRISKVRRDARAWLKDDAHD